MAQARYITLLIGEGRNNFIVEWNENREEDIVGCCPNDNPTQWNPTLIPSQ